MRNLLDVKFNKFIEDFHLQNESRDGNWRRFVNYHFFHNFSRGALIQILICLIKSALIPQSLAKCMASYFC